MSYPNAVEELKFAQDAALRARLLRDANCPELGCLYHRLGIASAAKAKILREIDCDDSQQGNPLLAGSPTRDPMTPVDSRSLRVASEPV